MCFRSMRKGLSEEVIFRLGTSVIICIQRPDNTELALRGHVLGIGQEWSGVWVCCQAVE